MTAFFPNPIFYNISMKNKSLSAFFLLLGLSVFPLVGCSAKEEGTKANIISSSSHLVVDESGFKKEYTDGESIDFSTLKVTFDSLTLTYQDEGVNKDENHFYVTDSMNDPTVAVSNNVQVQSSKKESQTFIYVAYKTEISGDVTYYVSAPITITIKNDNALSPWVLYTVTGLVFLCLIGFSFWKTSKRKKENKPVSVSSSDKPSISPLNHSVQKKNGQEEKKSSSSDDDEEV